MKKTGYLALTGILSSVLALSGCGSPAKQGGSSGKIVPITVWTYYNGNQLAAFNELVNEFNETVGKEKGIFLESSSQGTVTDLETNVLSAAEGKVGASEVPNIFAAYADTAYAVDQLGLAVDLTEYLTDEELSAYVESYIEEGRFSDEKSVKIFPTAKSVELLLLNKTDWEPFAQATGATYDDLATIEGLTAVAQSYYEWTDAKTPEPDDGKAFFGRDAMANYCLIGARQLGTELFHVENGKMTLDFNKETVRALWDNYYVPFVKGYFSATGRFRSDDVKVGNVISFVGSSSGATFFPDHVIVSDTESYPIEMVVLPSPKFAEGEDYAVQQGAGMVVTKGTDEEIQASVEFLKWFTAPERNISFSVASGYLPVTTEANDIDVIRESGIEITDMMDEILNVSVDTVRGNTLYTPKAFSKGTNARSILENALSDIALADRATVEERIGQGQSMEEAAEEFLTDDYFDAWYEKTQDSLKQYAD